MSNETKMPEFVRQMAVERGLKRALELFPDAVQAAAERGLKPLGALPAGTPPLIAPAVTFNPAHFEADE